jgi:hypothetical protein
MPYKDKEKQRAKQQAHYYANRDSEIAKAGERTRLNRLRLRAAIVEAKNVPCTDCGRSYPSYVMDFDHVGDDKDCEVANLVNRNVSLSRLVVEIAKCEVVCANCHRERTHCRLGELADPPDSESGDL